MSSQSDRISQLASAIAAQEALRPVLGDQAVDTVIATLAAQIDTLSRSEDLKHPSVHTVDSHLSLLVDGALIRLHETLPERSYLFKHALIQEAAYQSLLRHDRMEIHRRIAGCLAQLHAARLEDVAPLLAFHYSEAGDDAHTVEHSLVAAEAAARRFAYPEAVLHYTRAIDAAARLPNTPELRARRIDSIARHVELGWGNIHPADQLARLAEAETLARSLPAPDGTSGDQRRLARIHSMMAAMYLAGNELPQVERHTREVLAQAAALRDEALAITPLAQLGALLALQGRFADAVPYQSRALDLLGDDIDRWEWAWCHGFRAMSLAMRGQLQAGFAEAHHALARMEDRRNHVGVVQLRSYLLAVCLAAGDSERLLAESRIAAAVAMQYESALHASVALNFQALALSRLGRHTEARQCAAEGHHLTDRIGGQFMQSDWLAAAQAEIAANAGQNQEALSLAAQAITLAKGTRSDFACAWAERVYALALAVLDPARRPEAEAHLNESLRLLEQCDAPLEVERTRFAWSQTLCLCDDVKDMRNPRPSQIANESGMRA